MSVMCARNLRQQGMTLIEVLIALFILAIALAAVIKSIDTSISSTAYIKERTLGHWVAVNKANELQLGLISNGIGETSGEETMAETEWYWRINITETDEATLRRADIQVSVDRDANEPSATLVTYFGVLQ